MSTPTNLLSLFLAAIAPALAVAQDSTGLSVTLKAERGLVPAGKDVRVVMMVEATKDAAVPAILFNGTQLDVKVDDKDGQPVREAGAVNAPAVAVKAGTRIERVLSVPSATLVPAGASSMVNVALSWPGFPGANCMVKVAPDVSKTDIETLDLAQTKVVLVTSLGDMTLAFTPDKAPNHVKNFVKLAKDGFYDGTKFHRVIKNFMIQGGDPFTKDDSKASMWGQGDPGYKINAEFNDTKHVRGVLSMARSQDPNSAGSQFFICHKDAPHLDKQYTAFGALEKGLDVLDAIGTTAVGGPQGSTPVTPVVLFHAIVLPVAKK